MSSAAGSLRDVGVVVVAAGAGTRAGAGVPKQFRPIAGVPMLQRAVHAFTSHPAVESIVVVLPAADAADPPAWVARNGSAVTIIAGGARRADSVRAGLAALPDRATTVLVHDGARPFVSRETIDAVIARARTGVAAVAAVPVHDTLKEAAPDGLVLRTVAREGLWRAQTPQGFPRAMLTAAYASAEDPSAATDDAALCEGAGFPVAIVADSTRNIKVTTAEDFAVAEALARGEP